MAVSRRSHWLPTLAAIAVIALTVSLGNWQMRRADQKAQLLTQRQQAEREAPLDLDAAGASPVTGQRVAATGRFLADRSIFLDNRTHDGVAGFHVLTPLRLAGSARTVLVLRGWVAGDPADRSRLPRVRTPDEKITVSGAYEAVLDQPLQLGSDPVPKPSDRLWQFFGTDKYRTWSGLDVQPGIIRQASALDDGLVRDWPMGGPTVATHHGYAAQWYGLAALTALLWIWYTWRRWAERPLRR